MALREQVEQRAVESKDTEPMVTTDRFEQLAKQSSFNIYKSDLWQGTGERYSRMLVEECCQMMLDLESKYPANLAAREIKKHFGII